MNKLTAAVLLDISDSIAQIRFNRPETLNAIDAASALAFRDAVEAIAAQPGVRAVLLRGEGRAFMAGGDLQEMRQGRQHAAIRIIEPLHAGLRRLAELPVPVIASVQGAVAGAGLSIMMAADLAIASDDASFNMAYAKIGASLDASGSWHLPRIVGLRKAMEIALLCDTFDAHEALRLSIVNRVVPASELRAETDKLVNRLARGPTVALGRIKTLLRASLRCDLATQLDAEQAAFAACAAEDDFGEGLDAFLEKRRPSFRGH